MQDVDTDGGDLSYLVFGGEDAQECVGPGGELAVAHAAAFSIAAPSSSTAAIVRLTAVIPEEMASATPRSQISSSPRPPAPRLSGSRSPASSDLGDRDVADGGDGERDKSCQ